MSFSLFRQLPDKGPLPKFGGVELVNRICEQRIRLDSLGESSDRQRESHRNGNMNHQISTVPAKQTLQLPLLHPLKNRKSRRKNGGNLRLFRKREIKLQKGVDPTQGPTYMAPHRRGADGFLNRSTGLVANMKRIAGPPVKIGAPLLSAFLCLVAL